MLMRILGCGLAGGLAGGLIVAAIQLVTATPIILHAETFEEVAQVGLLILAHAPEGYDPGAGGYDTTRAVLTAIATVAVATGYAWILLSAMTARGAEISARSVIPWAIAGFVVTGLAPAFGLPPELPGAAAADLVARQTWWIGTAAATAAGLAAIAFGRTALWTAAGVALIVLPHIIGAPHTSETASRVPAEVAAHFVAVSLVIQALIWLIPASIAGFAVSKLRTA
jgi:cobalt transporter subunit CbtA